MSKQLAIASLFVLVNVAAGCAGGGNGDSCDPACASSQACCDGACVFLEIDRQNCGACGSVCNGTCSGGACIPGGFDAGPGVDGGPMPQGDCHPTCASGNRCCGTTCVAYEQPVGVDGRPANPDDPSSPFNNCNGCGLRCDPERSISCSIRPGAAGTSCSCGQLGACPAGEICLNTGTQWDCIDLQSDTQNCGSIGNACSGDETCSGGNCICASAGAPCGAGQTCCSGTCIDTASDATNCGGCGTTCGDEAPNCQDSMCVCGTGAGAHACTAPSGSDAGQSCCDGACVDNTASNCGCGVVCDSGDMCIVNSGFIPGTGGGGVCCGTGFGGLGGVCTGGGLPGLGDGGFGFGDGGLPF